jgi:hypothetical protein
MTIDRLWNLTLIFLISGFIIGRFAIFTNSGRGNKIWFLLFWLFCTSLFFTSGWLLAKSLQIRKAFTVLLVAFLTIIGFVSSNVIGLMTLLGLPILIPFSMFVIILLLVVKAQTHMK